MSLPTPVTVLLVDVPLFFDFLFLPWCVRGISLSLSSRFIKNLSIIKLCTIYSPFIIFFANFSFLIICDNLEPTASILSDNTTVSSLSVIVSGIWSLKIWAMKCNTRDSLILSSGDREVSMRIISPVLLILPNFISLEAIFRARSFE